MSDRGTYEPDWAFKYPQPLPLSRLQRLLPVG